MSSWRSRKNKDESRAEFEEALEAALDAEAGCDLDCCGVGSCDDGDPCCKQDAPAPVSVLQLDETECVGITSRGYPLHAATGGRLSAVIDGGRVLLTVYRDESLRHIRLDADQVDSLRRWLETS